MVSFDVKQLFTSIPINLALQAVTEALENEVYIQCNLKKESILKLVKICLQSTIFQFDGKIY